MANVSFTDHDIQAVSNAQKARILRDALPYVCIPAEVIFPGILLPDRSRRRQIRRQCHD